MSCKLLFAFIGLSFLTANQTLGAEINHQKLLEIVDESLAESDDAMIRQHPQGQRVLLLDFEALIYDIFIKINKQNNLDNKKFKLIKETFKKIDPKEFKDLKEERFNDYNLLSFHPMASINIESFKSLVFDSMISPQMLTQIGAGLKNLNDDEVAGYALVIFNTFANKTTTKEIVKLWSCTRVSPQALKFRHEKGCCLF